MERSGEHPTERSGEAGPVANLAPDPAALASLFLNHSQELRRFVLGVVRDPELADDVVQAAFVRAVERGGPAEPSALKAWLFRVAYHEAITARRRQGVRDRGRRRLAELFASRPDRPDDGLVRGETAEAVRRALERLPADQRRVVLARMDEDKTFAEIAGELGVPLGTVLTRMHRALGRLRAALEPRAGSGD